MKKFYPWKVKNKKTQKVEKTKETKIKTMLLNYFIKISVQGKMFQRSSSLENEKVEKCSRTDCSQENIDFVRASVAEEPVMPRN